MPLRPSNRTISSRHRLTPAEAERIKLQWRGARPIAAAIPIEFGDGSSLTDFNGACSCCGAPIPADHVRGTITRPTPTTAMIEARGACLACQTMVPFCYLCRTNPLRLEWQDEATGNWFVAVGRTRTQRFLRWLWDAITFQGVRS